MNRSGVPCLFFSVGEPSGDVHGANLIRQLKRRRPELQCVGLGGPRMREAGCQLQFELTSLAVMGLLRVLPLLVKFWRVYRDVGHYLDHHSVDAVVLIDFPGFNWWVARAAKSRGIPVYYYGAPQMWAWASWRIRKMKRLVDVALCKLAFEAQWYQRRGMRAIYVGHPFYDEIAQQTIDPEFIQRHRAASPLVLLLPGSRDQEIDRNLPTLVQAAARIRERHPTTRFVISCLHERHASVCIDRLEPQQRDWMQVVSKQTAELMRVSTACIACSGSVSLELMYNEVPTVIVYRISRWTMFLTNMLVKVRYITLVNLLWTTNIERTGFRVLDPDAADAEPIPFPEYVTIENPGERVARRVTRWLDDPKTLRDKRTELQELKSRVAELGASGRAADIILELLDGSRDSTNSPWTAAA